MRHSRHRQHQKTRRLSPSLLRPTAPLDTTAREVGPDGWDGLDGVYAFRYADATGECVDFVGVRRQKERQREAHDSQAHPSAQPPDTRRPPILLKAASVGACLTVTWLVGGTDAPSRGVELAVSDFVAPGAASGEPATYKSLDTLEAVLRAGLHGHRDDDEGAGASASASGGAPAPQRAPAPPPPGGPYPHPGDADRFPPGLGPGLPGIAHPFPFPPGVGDGGGGAMVGPHDPLFGGHPGVARPHAPWGGPPPPGLPPGARWDPIAPPGMPGFSPDDFRPPGPRPPGQGGGPRPPHPDIMPPGPGGPNPGWGGGMFG